MVFVGSNFVVFSIADGELTAAKVVLLLFYDRAT
jgi:hypothetical protein